MALFTQTALRSDFDRPNGVVGDPVSPSDPISLPLSDRTVVQVFDTKTTALSLLKQMRTVRKTWNVYASEDVLCVAVSYDEIISMRDELDQSEAPSRRSRPSTTADCCGSSIVPRRSCSR